MAHVFRSTPANSRKVQWLIAFLAALAIIVVGQIVTYARSHGELTEEAQQLAMPSPAYRPSTGDEKQLAAGAHVDEVKRAQKIIDDLDREAQRAQIDVQPQGKYLWATTKPNKLQVRFLPGTIVAIAIQYNGARRGQIIIGENIIALNPGRWNDPTHVFNLVRAEQCNHIMVEALGDNSQHVFFVKQLIIWVK